MTQVHLDFSPRHTPRQSRHDLKHSPSLEDRLEDVSADSHPERLDLLEDDRVCRDLVMPCIARQAPDDYVIR